MSTGTCRAADVTICGRKKQGKSSVTTAQAWDARAESNPLPAFSLGSIYARPRIVAAQRSQNKQWFAPLLGPLYRPIQAKIPYYPARGDHPVKDIVPILPDCQGVGGPDANLGNGAQCGVPNLVAVGKMFMRLTAIWKS